MSTHPAVTNGSAEAMGGPDVCKVPPAPPTPTPFPNKASASDAQASTCSDKVWIVKKRTCTLKTVISRSSRNAGTLKGLKSSTLGGEVKFKSGSDKVRVEGEKIVHLTSSTSHNGGNAPAGKVVKASQDKVLVS
jgi:hypothetical protein